MATMEKRVLENLEKAGWHLKPSAIADLLQDIREDEENARMNERDLEKRLRSDLLDTDLCTIGARYLPDAQALLHLHTLQTPCILQVAAINDISESNQRAGSAGSTGRLLRIRLTDGHSSLTAIEHRPVPSLSLDISPGTKVVLQGSITVQSGIVLLDPGAIRVEGGHVAALHEAWVMQRKYAGALSRPTTGSSSGPPPFRALQTGAKAAQAPEKTVQTDTVSTAAAQNVQSNKPSQDVRAQVAAATATIAHTPESTTGARSSKSRMRPGAEPYRPRLGNVSEAKRTEARASASDMSTQASLSETAGAPQKPPVTQTTQPQPQPQSQPQPVAMAAASPSPAVGEAKEGVSERVPEKLGSEAVPVQNRQAAQKLLERRTDAGPGLERGRGRGRGFRRGGGRHDADDHDNRVMTLDEWEARKSTSSSSCAVSDQELALRLQEQFNMEDSHGGQPKQLNAAEQLRLSMFNFVPEPTNEENGHGRGGGRGRGRGRGRGWGRGRRY